LHDIFYRAEKHRGEGPYLWYARGGGQARSPDDKLWNHVLVLSNLNFCLIALIAHVPQQSVVVGGRLFQNKKHASMMRISVQSKVCGVETNDQSEVCRVGTIGDSTVGRQYSYLGPLSPSLAFE